MRLRSAPAAVLLAGLLAGGVLVSACSSSSGGSSDATRSTSQAPEDVLVPNAQVAAGLANLGALVAQAGVQARAGADTVKDTANEAWEQWEKIEGRIKKNDIRAYLEFEDALSDVRTGAQDGDAAKVQKGATTIASLITTYLGQFPG